MGRYSSDTLFEQSSVSSKLLSSQPRSSFKPAQGENDGTATLTATQPYFSRYQRAPCLYVPLRNRHHHLRNPHADNGRDRNAREERESVNVGSRARSAKVGERRDRRHSLPLSLSFRLLLPSVPPYWSLMFNCSRIVNCIVFPFFVFEPLKTRRTNQVGDWPQPARPGRKMKDTRGSEGARARSKRLVISARTSSSYVVGCP